MSNAAGDAYNRPDATTQPKTTQVKAYSARSQSRPLLHPKSPPWASISPGILYPMLTNT
jgi:hypothetical protein